MLVVPDSEASFRRPAMATEMDIEAPAGGGEHEVDLGNLLIVHARDPVRLSNGTALTE